LTQKGIPQKTGWLSLFFIGTLVPFSFLLLRTRPLLAASPIQFRIAFTNDVMGEVEPCG
jgi:hypothetical protein